MLRFLLCQLLSYALELRDRPGHAPPGVVLQRRVTLAVQSEIRVILALDQPVSPLELVATPWLHGQRLVEVTFLPLLLVAFLDLGLDRLGR